MNKRKITALLLVLLLAAGLFTLSALADAGNFSGSSDYGGGSSWGGSDYGGGSSWGDSDWGGSDYGSNYVFIGDGGDDVGSVGIGGVAILVIIVVLYLIMKSKINSGSGGGTVVNTGVTTAPPANLRPMSQLREVDPSFSEEALKEKISNLYVRMQNAWQDKDFEPMRPYMTDSLYSQFDRQLQSLKQVGATNYVDRIAVLGVTLEGWTEDESNQTVSALVNTRIVDYTKDDNTGKLLSGSETAEKFMCYRWSLIRSAGMTTPGASGSGSEGSSTLHCPSCGAPLDVNHSARCPYCDSIISARDYDWCISAISGISQRTSGR